MTDLLHEQLSALIDGELSAAETRVLLKRLEREPSLRERLSRYRVCGATLRGQRIEARSEFCVKVSTLLISEPCHATEVRRIATATTPSVGRVVPRYLQVFGGLGIAAAVAVAAILVIARPGAPAGGGVEIAAVVTPPPAAVATTTVPAPAAPARRAVEAPSYPAMNAALGNEPASYVTPAARQGLNTIPPAELASYVVAHSGVSDPMRLRSALTTIVSADPGSGTPAR